MMLTWTNSTVPTEDQILVPETLLKKRKSQEKERENRAAELEKKKAVRHKFYVLPSINDPRQVKKNLTAWMMMMMHINHATRSIDGRCCRFSLTIFRV